jgi:peroxiredoxin
VARTDSPYDLPEGLPVPIDDGATDHLTGMIVPSVPLTSTRGSPVDLARLSGRIVVYCYPRTGQPDIEPPKGWNQIPGARGCTPQSCGFRDSYAELRALGTDVFGLSTQTPDYQLEAVQRLKLPFDLLSDSELSLTQALKLPTFEVESMTLIKRLTLIISDARIQKVFYPVFPPDKNAAEVVKWLSRNRAKDKPLKR